MKISDIIVESTASNATGPKFGGYYGATQKGPPKPGQSFGGAAESKNNKKLSWNDLPGHLTTDERADIFEQYVLRGNLTESNDENSQENFQTLFNMSDRLVKDSDYFVVPLMLVNNRLVSLNEPEYLRFIRQEDHDIVFDSDIGEKKYPYNLFRNTAMYHVFAFETCDSYDKFRTVVNLKFDYNLPEFKSVDHPIKLSEVAPLDQEDWVRKNKERFIKQYGKERGTRILYATANKRSKK